MFVLSSKDKTSGSSHDGVIQLTNNTKLHGKYQLLKCVIPNSFYNVSNLNNKLYVEHSVDGNNTLTLTNGYYTSSELATELKTQLDSISAVTYTVSFDSLTSKYTFTPSAGNFGFKFTTNTSNSCRKLIGKNAVDDTLGASQISDNNVDLAPYKVLYFSIPSAGNYVLTSQNVNSSFYISVNEINGEEIRQDYHNDLIYLEFNQTINVSFKIHDHDGNLVDLNGVDWYLILKKI